MADPTSAPSSTKARKSSVCLWSTSIMEAIWSSETLSIAVRKRKRRSSGVTLSKKSLSKGPSWRVTGRKDRLSPDRVTTSVKDGDRKSVEKGKRVSGRVDLGGRRIITIKILRNQSILHNHHNSYT